MKRLLLILTVVMLFALNASAQEVKTNYPFVKDKNIARAIDYIAAKDKRVLPALEKLYTNDRTYKVEFITIEVNRDVIARAIHGNTKYGGYHRSDFSQSDPNYWTAKHKNNYPFALTEDVKDALDEVYDYPRVADKLSAEYKDAVSKGKKFKVFGVIRTKAGKGTNYEFIALRGTDSEVYPFQMPFQLSEK